MNDDVTTNEEIEVIEIEVPKIIELFISPYNLAKVVDVRPQMMYNYINKGYIKSSKNTLGKKQIKREDANAWIAKYYAKNRAK